MKLARGASIPSCVLLLLLVCRAPILPAQTNLDAIRHGFQNPPDDTRVMMRWWWFGPAVTKPELEREITAMKAAGLGGFEVQPVYPMTLDDPAQGIQNLPYLSPPFLDALRFAAHTARRLGMRFDLTLGSGWPYGGPNTPVTQASGALRVEKTPLTAGATDVPVPSIALGENLLAVFLVHPDPKSEAWKDIRQISAPAFSNGRLLLSPPATGSELAVFFIASRTGMMVKRPAVGAEGFVLDHLDPAAVQNHLEKVGEPILDALRDAPPYAVFSDSLEVYGADWTPELLDQFRRRRGYDLLPHLPALVADVGPETYDVRYDWSRTLTELLDENYLQPIRDWAHRHHTLFRSQNYGPPGAILSSNQFVDLPEGEGANWRGFSPLRWASSANHFYGHAVTSSESFTWTHTLPFAATPLDLKAEADIDFLEGSNQLIGHGWPYSPAYVPYPGWSFYAAGALNDSNPWWIVMPDVTKYMQRISYLLRQGSPVADVALLLPTEDAWAYATPDPQVPNDMVESISDNIDGRLGTRITGQIVDAGFNLDYIDSHIIDTAGIGHHPILILPGITRIPLRTYQSIEAFARQGGMVIATRTLPSHAPGFETAAADSAQVREISKRLFQCPSAPGRFLPSESALSEVLSKAATPDMKLSSPSAALGFVHRRIAEDADIYFVANTSNQPVRREATFRTEAQQGQVWDPFSARSTPTGNRQSVELDLAPYESKVIVFSSFLPPTSSRAGAHAAPPSLDFSGGWNITFPEIHQEMVMRSLHSWTDYDKTRFYSGQALYKRKIDVPPAYLQSGISLWLDFGAGTPVTEKPQEDGMRAWLDSPIREAALVYVNGRLAGSVWHPPYRLEITSLLKPGENRLQLVVANTAINTLAGRSAPAYRLLHQRYGERFTPQHGMRNIEPLPAGVLGAIRLLPIPPPLHPQETRP